MPHLHRHVGVHAVPHVVGRHDVERRHALDAAGMIERQPIGDAAAAVVTGEAEAHMAERLHDLDHGLGHRALVVGRVLRVRFGHRRPAVAGQVGDHQRETLRRVPAPRGATLRWFRYSRAAATAAARCRRRGRRFFPPTCRSSARQIRETGRRDRAWPLRTPKRTSGNKLACHGRACPGHPAQEGMAKTSRTTKEQSPAREPGFAAIEVNGPASWRAARCRAGAGSGCSDQDRGRPLVPSTTTSVRDRTATHRRRTRSCGILWLAAKAGAAASVAKCQSCHELLHRLSPASVLPSPAEGNFFAPTRHRARCMRGMPNFDLEISLSNGNRRAFATVARIFS